MEQNPESALAWQFIESTGTHLFLTGKAGTGKTTFLRKLKQESPKRMVVVAPTGIAAINADRKSTRLNSSHITRSRMPSSA